MASSVTSPPILDFATVTQTGSLTDAVELNAQAGVVTTIAGATAALANSRFTLNNSAITANSVVFVSLVNSDQPLTGGSGIVEVCGNGLTAGSIQVVIQNPGAFTTGTVSDPVYKIGFIVL